MQRTLKPLKIQQQENHSTQQIGPQQIPTKDEWLENRHKILLVRL